MPTDLNGWEGVGCICVHVTYAPTVSAKLRSFDALKFILTIHEVNNVRSFQQVTITAYNGFTSTF